MDQPFPIPQTTRVTGYGRPHRAFKARGGRWLPSGNGVLCHESFMDEMCHAAGVDPLQERLRLCWPTMPRRKVFRNVGEMSEWGSDLGPNRRGLAFTLGRWRARGRGASSVTTPPTAISHRQSLCFCPPPRGRVGRVLASL